MIETHMSTRRTTIFVLVSTSYKINQEESYIITCPDNNVDNNRIVDNYLTILAFMFFSTYYKNNENNKKKHHYLKNKLT